ncbi:Pol Polyprotein [Phytophthora megakarya]|uniref:Pol Polyprotein n=1 Tax=Phytophthora megakarya TaxID=4795 RepID=A0A225W045_9STRA|nr:Pol Polyprotein [Phytophthora megakarya]
MKDACADKWKQAIKEELEALEQNGAWKQEYGVDYFYTFSAVLEIVSGRVEAELAIILLISQGMKFTDEEPKALGVKNKHELVLILEKALYGLKHSGRLWNHLLHSILVKLGVLPVLHRHLPVC